MDWKDVVTAAIALYAAWTARGARKEAASASAETRALQLRLEQYEYLPIVKVDVVPDGERVKILITNSSPKCVVTSFEVKSTLRISVEGGLFSLDRDDFIHKGGLIAAGKVEEVSLGDVNQAIADMLPALSRLSPEQYNFVLRVYVKCLPPHPDAPTVNKEGVGFFTYDNGQLNLRNGPNKPGGKIR